MSTTPRTYTDFGEIPRFIEGHDVVDIPIFGIQRQLEHYQEYYGLDANPDFQRAHVWNREQQISFVEHVLRGGRNTVIRWNCPGWSQNRRDSGPVQLVDGKQRLEAVLAFISNQIPAFGTKYQDYTGKLEITTGLKFMMNSLQTRTQILQWYLEINRGNVAHTREELEKVEILLEKEKA